MAEFEFNSLDIVSNRCAFSQREVTAQAYGLKSQSYSNASAARALENSVEYEKVQNPSTWNEIDIRMFDLYSLKENRMTKK